MGLRPAIWVVTRLQRDNDWLKIVRETLHILEFRRTMSDHISE